MPEWACRPVPVMTVPQDDHPERVLHIQPLPQLVDVGRDPLLVRSSARRERRAVT